MSTPSTFPKPMPTPPADMSHSATLPPPEKPKSTTSCISEDAGQPTGDLSPRAARRAAREVRKVSEPPRSRRGARRTPAGSLPRMESPGSPSPSRTSPPAKLQKIIIPPMKKASHYSPPKPDAFFSSPHTSANVPAPSDGEKGIGLEEESEESDWTDDEDDPADSPTRRSSHISFDGDAELRASLADLVDGPPVPSSAQLTHSLIIPANFDFASAEQPAPDEEEGAEADTLLDGEGDIDDPATYDSPGGQKPGPIPTEHRKMMNKAFDHMDRHLLRLVKKTGRTKSNIISHYSVRHGYRRAHKSTWNKYQTVFKHNRTRERLRIGNSSATCTLS